jgi:hypothetical protein
MRLCPMGLNHVDWKLVYTNRTRLKIIQPHGGLVIQVESFLMDRSVSSGSTGLMCRARLGSMPRITQGRLLSTSRGSP